VSSFARISGLRSRLQVLGLVCVLVISFPACTDNSDENPSPANLVSTDLEEQSVKPNSPRLAIRWSVPHGEKGLDAVYRSGQETHHLSIVETLGGGVGIIDYDRDGREDIFLPGGGYWLPDDSTTGSPNSLLRNMGALHFVNIADDSFVSLSDDYSHGANVGDYDQDGFADLHVTGLSYHRLVRNQGDGTFEEVSAGSGLVSNGWSSSSAWGDFNKDGQLDLYVAHYVKWSAATEPHCSDSRGERDVCGPTDFEGQHDVLLYQTGSGMFENVSSYIMQSQGSRGLGVAVGDWDGDGDSDIYVANDANPNFLFSNQSDGTFKEVGNSSGTALGSASFPDGSMGIGVGDFDGNLHPDFLITNFDGQHHELYSNQGNQYYRLATRTSGLMALGNSTVGWGIVWNDADCDGDEDVLFLTGHPSYGSQHRSAQQPPVFLENERGRRLISRGAAVGEYFGRATQGRGLAMADFDLDGDFDAVASEIQQPAQLLRNDSDRLGNFLDIELIGTASNRDAIGAIVECQAGTQNNARHRFSGGSYCSSTSRVLHIGLGENKQVDRLIVRWPSGNSTSLENIPSDSRIQIVEGQPQYK
jgi:enediyne biosynthesis protein E4